MFSLFRGRLQIIGARLLCAFHALNSPLPDMRKNTHKETSLAPCTCLPNDTHTSSRALAALRTCLPNVSRSVPQTCLLNDKDTRSEPTAPMPLNDHHTHSRASCYRLRT